MRDKDSPEVIAYLDAENAYTAAFMAPTADLQAKLYSEMLSHIKETDESVPYRLGNWFYSTRTVEGRQYPIHSRRAATSPDLELLRTSTPPSRNRSSSTSTSSPKASPSWPLAPWPSAPTATCSPTPPTPPASASTPCIFATCAPETDLPDTADRVGSLAWAADSRTLFYSTEDETTKRQDHIFRHALGAAADRRHHRPHEETSASTSASAAPATASTS